MKLTKWDFALLGIIIYFTFIGGTFYSQLNLFLRVANQVIVTVILGWWLLARLRRGQGLPTTPLDIPIALYLVVNLLSAVFGQSPRYSLEMIWFSIVHVLALYLLVDLIRRGRTAGLTWAFYMASAVVCLVGLAEFAGWYFGTSLFTGFSQGWAEIGGWRQPIPPQIYRLNITLNGSTPLAAYLALLITPAIGLVISLPRRSENRKALLVWLAPAVLVEILTFSRAGILALSVSLTLLLLGWAAVTGKGWPDILAYWSRRTGLQRVLVLLGGVVGISLGLFWLQKSFFNRAHSTGFRFQLWGAALEIFQDHWLFGAGPANFGRALLRLNDPDLPRRQIATAHNVYLNTAAELGILGLGVGAMLMVVFGWSWWRRWQKTSGRSEQIRLIACGAALVGLAVQTLVDTYTATPNVLVMLALVAYVVGDLRDGPFSVTRPRPYAAYAALAALGVYIVGFFWIGLADYHFQKSFRAERAGHLPQAVAEAAQARSLDPALALRTFRLALLEARLAHQTEDEALIQAALNHYRLGLQQEPILGVNSANLAGLLWQQGQTKEAIETLHQTAEATEAPLYRINLGYFYEQTGDWTQAAQAYGRALALSPELAASGFWQATPDRAARWPTFVEAAVEATAAAEPARRSLRVNLAFARQEFEMVEDLLRPVRPLTNESRQAILAETYLIQEQPERAADLLASDLEDRRDYFFSGWLKLQTADRAEAEQLLKIAAFLGYGEAYYQLGQLYEAQADRQAAERAYSRGFALRTSSEDVAVNIYGRLGGNDLAPQLIRIGIGPHQARSWLALARLYEEQQQNEAAARIYRLLLAEDPFLEVARERLNRLADD